MWSPRLARFVSWCLAIAVHEILFLGALCVQGEKVHVTLLKPDVYTAMVPDPRMVPQRRPEPVATAPAWAGRWPMDCTHESLLRMPSDQIVADTRCKVCQWPWWVVRTSLRD